MGLQYGDTPKDPRPSERIFSYRVSSPSASSFPAKDLFRRLVAFVRRELLIVFTYALSDLQVIYDHSLRCVSISVPTLMCFPTF